MRNMATWCGCGDSLPMGGDVLSHSHVFSTAKLVTSWSYDCLNVSRCRPFWAVVPIASSVQLTSASCSSWRRCR